MLNVSAAVSIPSSEFTLRSTVDSDIPPDDVSVGIGASDFPLLCVDDDPALSTLLANLSPNSPAVSLAAGVPALSTLLANLSPNSPAVSLAAGVSPLSTLFAAASAVSLAAFLPFFNFEIPFDTLLNT